MSSTHAPAAAGTSGLDRFFKITERGSTVGQEIRQIYVPAGVSIAVGVLLACLAPVASRSKH